MWVKGSNEYQRMAFSYVILRTWSSGTSFLVNSDPNSSGAEGHMESLCGKSASQAMLSMPMRLRISMPDRITDEARQKVLPEDLARKSATEVLQCPCMVHLECPVKTVEEVRNPSGPAF